MDSNCNFSYWKKPWHKWMVLAVGAMQLPLLYTKIQDYKKIIKADIFSPQELSQYIMQQKFSCMVTILVAVCFFVTFFIGSFSKSKKAAKLAESILMFGLAGILSAGIIIWHKAIYGLWLWAVILCFIWGINILTIFQLWKERHK